MDVLLAIAVRATVTYLYLLVIIRISGKRLITEGTPFDLVVALVVGDFPDDLIWGEVPVAQGLVAMGSIMLLHTMMAWATWRSVRLDRLVSGGPRPVIRDGRVLTDALRAEHLNAADLASALRQHGLEDPADAAEAFVEPSGHITVRRRRVADAVRRRDLDVLDGATG